MFLIQFNVLNCGLLSSQVASHHNFRRISLQSSTDFKQVVLYVCKFSSIMDMLMSLCLLMGTDLSYL